MRYFIIFVCVLFPFTVSAEAPVWGCTGEHDATGAPLCGLGHWRTYCEIFLVSGGCGPVFELLRPEVSNVLFLPGIKGSRLYVHDEQLWEPYGSEDVRKLFLTEEGLSADPAVYARTGDLLSEVLGTSFYTSFLSGLESAETDETYGPLWTWESGAYDWRLSLNDVVTRGARYDDRVYFSEANGMPYLERLLRDLADTSATGKVTIVAHSNGGLVAKRLMQTLGNEAGELVDQMVFVGVPQGGAPRAIAGALFGYGEALPFDSCATKSSLCALLVDRETARTFAEQSPMTYHLLPSGALFGAHTEPSPVTWNGTYHYANERNTYGSAIDTTSELYDFLVAREGGRRKPAPEDIGSANVLSETLISYADTTHLNLDPWIPPAGVEVHQIAGWGHETFSGIEFYEEPRLIGLPVPRYRPAFTNRGDGIVPGTSAAPMSGENVHTYWLNLFEHDYSHADLLENEGVQKLIHNILVGSSDLPAGISEAVPIETTHRLLFILHSPLTLGITDSTGAYTGLTESGDVLQERDDIEYGTFGETQYLSAPGGEPYTITLNGTGEGTFSLDVQDRTDNTIGTTTTFANVPVTQTTVATLTVPVDITHMSDLLVDTDGDESIDIHVAPRNGVISYEEKKEDEHSLHVRSERHEREPEPVVLVQAPTPSTVSHVRSKPAQPAQDIAGAYVNSETPIAKSFPWVSFLALPLLALIWLVWRRY